MSSVQHYRVGQVVALIGVSISALRHHDDIGLLHPSKRLKSGHRLYSSADLLKLQQILILRYLGFELRQIRDLLRRADFDVLASLRIQRGVVRDRISQLERIKASLSRLVDHRLASGEWAWKVVAEASAVVQQGLRQCSRGMGEGQVAAGASRTYDLGGGLPFDNHRVRGLARRLLPLI